MHYPLVSISDNPAPQFDWYRATLHGTKPQLVVHEISKQFPLASTRPCNGRHGYDRGAQIHVGEKVKTTIWWSSNGKNKGVCVDASGENSTPARAALQHLEHRVTRADVCLDYSEDGLFDYLAARFQQYAIAKNIKLDQMGDWTRGKSRTLYIGSRKSSAYLRLYEKGQKEGGDPNWIRLELELKPKGEAGYYMANKGPADYFSACTWVKSAFQHIGIKCGESDSISAKRKPDDLVRAKIALVKQYKRLMLAWMDQHSSPESFTTELSEAFELLEKHQKTGDLDDYNALLRHLDTA